jgi:hypothetical protein
MACAGKENLVAYCKAQVYVCVRALGLCLYMHVFLGLSSFIYLYVRLYNFYTLPFHTHILVFQLCSLPEGKLSFLY